MASKVDSLKLLLLSLSVCWCNCYASDDAFSSLLIASEFQSTALNTHHDGESDIKRSDRLADNQILADIRGGDIGGEQQGLIDDLKQQRDISANAVAEQAITTVSSNNLINTQELNSGKITISEQSMQHFKGLGNFSLNTGSNSSVSAGINVNIILTP